MIKIPYGTEMYGINADKYGYSVGKIAIGTTKVKDENGKEYEVEKEYITSPLYPTSLKSCLQVILEWEQRKVVANNNLELLQALDRLEQIQVELSNILARVEKIGIID